MTSSQKKVEKQLSAEGHRRTVVINATNIGRYLNGIGTYTLSLLRELSTIEGNFSFIFYLNRSCAEQIKDIRFSGHCAVRWTTSWISPDHGFKGHLLRLLYSYYLSLKHPHSLMFNTSQIEGILFRSNQIITIHDVIPLLFKKWHKKQYYYFKFYLPWVLKSARGIITPSHHTKDLLIELYRIEEEKIRVIHNGIQEKWLDEFKPASMEDQEFILYAGRLTTMKNITGLLRAFSMIMNRVPHKLLIIGGRREEFERALKKTGLPSSSFDNGRIVFKGQVTAEEMRRLLNRASIFVFPSFYEGFGLPPLEAMASGCPVVVSNVASLPEVCGEAACYVDPYAVESIADGMQRTLTDRRLRQRLIEKGRQRASLFRWEESARQHLEVFREILRKPSIPGLQGSG